jgi:hypothetical protein
MASADCCGEELFCCCAEHIRLIGDAVSRMVGIDPANTAGIDSGFVHNPGTGWRFLFFIVTFEFRKYIQTTRMDWISESI